MNRRYVWSFIEKFKKDRVIILTTHSMEEADVVCFGFVAYQSVNFVVRRPYSHYGTRQN